MNSSSKNHTVLITGANRGIGLALTQLMLREGAHVIAVCRQSSEALSDSGAEVIEGIDVTSEESVQKLARAMEGRDLDWVVNNAGVLEQDSVEHLDFEAMVRQFRVNTLGPLRLTVALRENLDEGSKAFVISSAVGSIGDNSSGGLYGYRVSKAAVNMAFKNLSIDFRDDGIGVFILHPGYVQTDMTGGQGNVDAEESASGLIARMKELDLSQTGTFRHARGHDLEW